MNGRPVWLSRRSTTCRATVGGDHVGRTASRFLFAGFACFVVTMIVGVIWLLLTNRAMSPEIMPIGEIPRELRAGDPMAVIDLALLILIATPVVTMAAVATAFFRSGERRLALTALLVLAILIVSFALAASR